MSFGFGVGDFIAVGELCWKLYSQVYEVSRGAPEAIQNLKAELGDMHLTINKLVEDTKDPDSILVQSGPDRLNLACRALEKTHETLKKLDDLSGKYELLQKPSSNLGKRHFWKRNYDKVKFAAESHTINDLRAKLVFHNGQISLLLQMVQSSSLERIENRQKKTENALQNIKAALSGTTSLGHTPLLSGFKGTDQHFMTRKLMKQAEINDRAWTSIGIRDWLQTGKWWLLKAQSQIHTATPSTPEYRQAWVNLIKASWILTDIVAVHPQRHFFGSGHQELDVLDLVQAVKTQHEDLAKESVLRPTLRDLEDSTWQIWMSTPSTALLPTLGDGGSNSRQWGTIGGFILLQK
ncbi:uncharacterized protein LTHEOB_9950 [Lasiodiplodia theobromae]|uniref:uncharacterized protein n=1 Tax=Lasiodiplodia theobromae TaxID=45133 RepID=UPI0015C3104E|nr:uncharacterized protein LTHEOB_9950 [Lasiodiplodia theobromae]KAF4539561.1 hypothetical protein LTHEOB_9950 [Lasiodiplodia theobromae]